MIANELRQLKHLVEGMGELNEAEWLAFSSIWQPYAAKRKELISHAGEKEKYLYFVLSGVQRIYYRDEEDREATLVFTYAPSFGGVLDAMLLNQKSSYYYEAISRSEFLRAPFEEVERLMGEHKNIDRLIFKGVSFALKGVLERMAELLSCSSEEKFKRLLTRSPHILQHVPHKYLANYLGIDPSNFSKLINKIVI
ncbi:MAG: Crp/Fnr family transcriptional regulator [Daejeonella sp.]|uniref:Crp/Fnr family transcriptional regulator n=1 Tax=Daejeonella sp. JGW-45 TaxID=3034148 RepID=UPI0023EADD00|nr:Crp/Fnr family transcriptional regulator [Daejeonella sp. JGW-45]